MRLIMDMFNKTGYMWFIKNNSTMAKSFGISIKILLTYCSLFLMIRI